MIKLSKQFKKDTGLSEEDFIVFCKDNNLQEDDEKSIKKFYKYAFNNKVKQHEEE